MAEAEESKQDSAKITEQDIERAKRQIGVPKFSHDKPYNAIASSGALSHFAFGAGDDNPLWHDREYGATTRWRDQIGCPLFLASTGINLTPKPTPELKALFKGLFRGVGKYQTGMEWTWWRPVYPEDKLYVEKSTSDVSVRENSRFSGGRTVTEIYRDLWVDRTGFPVGKREQSFMSAEREGTKKQAKYSDLKRHTYTPDDIARIDAVYAAEELRGKTKRYWEDVNVGDELVPVAKGPFSIVDVMGWHMGQGLSNTAAIGPLRYNWKQRGRMPGYFSVDRYGVPETVQRVHWDHDRAVELGLPTSYDYGQMRTAWLVHLVTNWMGDDGWLWRFSNETRRFNYMGDTTICSGTVKDKRRDGRYCVAELELKGTNQRGEVTTTGSAIVILPSREHGAMVLPTPPEDMLDRGAMIVQGAADRESERAAERAAKRG